MTGSPDWDAIIQKHLDGQTTTEEAKTLSAQIVADAEVRSCYLKAALVHGALTDEAFAVELEAEPDQAAATEKTRPVQPFILKQNFAWAQQIVPGLIAGALVGLLGVGVVWAVGSPKSQARLVPVPNADFEDSVGPVEIGFPTNFGGWSGDPAEVIEEPDGNRLLRFLETANVTGKPNGGATACNVFQIIDLSTLQQQWDTEDSDFQVTLKLSARFRRESAANDAELPKLRGGLAIHLYRAQPESIGKAWPLVIRDAIAVGKKIIKLEPGEEAATISASCILTSEATIALLSLNANTRIPTKTPIPLGGYFVDGVKLTVTKQPAFPVKFVK